MSNSNNGGQHRDLGRSKGITTSSRSIGIMTQPTTTSLQSVAETSNGTTRRRIKKARPRSRVFSIRNWSFRCLHNSLWDVALDGVQSFFEGIVLLLGPVLIVLALAMTTMLSFTFFDILVPMMLEKHDQRSFKWGWIGLHCVWVVFLLINVLFNYFMCVVTRNSGPKYDVVVREMADATGFIFPETPDEVERYRLEYEDKMTLRIRRRREREKEKEEGKNSSNSFGAVNGDGTSETKNDHLDILQSTLVPPTTDTASAMTHRKQAGQTPSSNNPASDRTRTTAPANTVRRWMLMGPFEWGFCHNSKQPKPPRSHYDHVTKRLVLNLDH